MWLILAPLFDRQSAFRLLTARYVANIGTEIMLLAHKYLQLSFISLKSTFKSIEYSYINSLEIFQYENEGKKIL